MEQVDWEGLEGLVGLVGLAGTLDNSAPGLDCQKRVEEGTKTHTAVFQAPHTEQIPAPHMEQIPAARMEGVVEWWGAGAGWLTVEVVDWWCGWRAI